MPLPMIPASETVTITPPEKAPVYDRWWMGMTIDESDTENVKVIVRLRRARVDDNGKIQWMSDAESQSSGMPAIVGYTVDHVLERAAGTYVPPLGDDGNPIADPLVTPEVQGILAQVAGGMMGGVTRMGQILKVI